MLTSYLRGKKINEISYTKEANLTSPADKEISSLTVARKNSWFKKIDSSLGCGHGPQQNMLKPLNERSLAGSEGQPDIFPGSEGQ